MQAPEKGKVQLLKLKYSFRRKGKDLDKASFNIFRMTDFNTTFEATLISHFEY